MKFTAHIYCHRVIARVLCLKRFDLAQQWLGLLVFFSLSSDLLSATSDQRCR